MMIAITAPTRRDAPDMLRYHKTMTLEYSDGP
jgi:hypothetical protein